MIGALIIVFREVIEAGLIVGIVMAVTRGIPGRMPFIVGGVGAGLVGAGLVAAFASAISGALAGMGQEVFNASILGIAVLMLGWHNIWMASHGREMAQEFAVLGRDVTDGKKSLLALASVIGVAVLREGAEVVLFLYGILATDQSSGWNMFLGGMAGLALGVALSAATFAGLVAIPVRYLFKVTSLLIAFMAAGMAAQAVALLEQAGLINVLNATLWNTSEILSDTSVFGKILHTLFGYTEQPSLIQFIAYVATLAVIFGLMRLIGGGAPAKPSGTVQTAQA